MKTFHKYVAAFATLALLGAGCANGGSLGSGDTQEQVDLNAPVKIGWMGPLTGDAAVYGESIKRAVELAQAEAGVDNIELIFEDSKCAPKDAATAVNKLVNIDQVQAIIGEVCSGATLAAVPTADEAKVVMISSSATSPELETASDYFFRTVPSDALQGNFAADLVRGDGHETLAVLYINDDYGLGFERVLREAFENDGGSVVASESFAGDTADLRTQITKIQSAGPDAVYILSNSPDAAVLAMKQMAELDLDAALYGSEALANQQIVTDAEGAAEGLIVSTVSAGSDAFTQLHNSKTGVEPGPFAAQAYDAYMAIAMVVKQGARGGEAMKDALNELEFGGATGPIVFDDNGGVTGNYDVLIVQDGTLQSR